MAEKTDLRKLVRRIEETGEFIKHDVSRCTGCVRCVKICPMNIWGMRRGKATLDPAYSKKCLECGACWMVCPKDAIEFRYPNGGSGVTWEYG